MVRTPLLHFSKTTSPVILTQCKNIKINRFKSIRTHGLIYNDLIN